MNLGELWRLAEEIYRERDDITKLSPVGIKSFWMKLIRSELPAEKIKEALADWMYYSEHGKHLSDDEQIRDLVEHKSVSSQKTPNMVVDVSENIDELRPSVGLQSVLALSNDGEKHVFTPIPGGPVSSTAIKGLILALQQVPMSTPVTERLTKWLSSWAHADIEASTVGQLINELSGLLSSIPPSTLEEWKEYLGQYLEKKLGFKNKNTETRLSQGLTALYDAGIKVGSDAWVSHVKAMLESLLSKAEHERTRSHWVRAFDETLNKLISNAGYPEDTAKLIKAAAELVASSDKPPEEAAVDAFKTAKIQLKHIIEKPEIKMQTMLHLAEQRLADAGLDVSQAKKLLDEWLHSASILPFEEWLKNRLKELQ